MKILYLYLGFFALCAGMAFSQDLKEPVLTAYVEPDSGKTSIRVSEVQLSFKFAGYGVYNPEDYPVMNKIPLENGMTIKLNQIAEMQFRAERVSWKKFIPQKERHQYKDVDEEGYRRWSAVEVNAKIKDWDGKSFNSRILRPEFADIYLTGQTNNGVYNLQIDQENDKVIHVVFEAEFVMQCEKDHQHIFPNKSWKYCPLCGAKLKKHTRKDYIKKE